MKVKCNCPCHKNRNIRHVIACCVEGYKMGNEEIGPSLDDLTKAWEERMKRKAELEAEEEAKKAEKLRQDYIRRRGNQNGRS